jgi:hypothetical protein
MRGGDESRHTLSCVQEDDFNRWVLTQVALGANLRTDTLALGEV